MCPEAKRSLQDSKYCPAGYYMSHTLTAHYCCLLIIVALFALLQQKAVCSTAAVPRALRLQCALNHLECTVQADSDEADTMQRPGGD